MAPPRVAAGLVAALLLAGRAADVVAQSHGSQPPSASLEDDLAILLAFRAVGANSQDNWVRTWAAGGGGPCDEASFDRENAGWKMVMCCASYDWSAYSQDGDCTGANARRVTYLNLYSLQVSGDIGPLGRLVELQNLDLHGTAVAGDVAALATLGQLQYLSLSSTAVAGDVAALAALGQLQYLYLSDTAVWGRADALRAIPGLGAGWKQFIACSHTAYGDRTIGYFGLCPVGRSDVADAASYIGVDKCACCSGSLKMRDPTTGACVDLECVGVDCAVGNICADGECVVDPCVGVDCGAHGTCSGGTCFCESGYTGDRCTDGPDDATPVVLLIVLVACSTVVAVCCHKRKQLLSKNGAGEGIYDSMLGAPPLANSETP